MQTLHGIPPVYRRPVRSRCCQTAARDHERKGRAILFHRRRFAAYCAALLTGSHAGARVLRDAQWLRRTPWRHAGGVLEALGAPPCISSVAFDAHVSR